MKKTLLVLAAATLSLGIGTLAVHSSFVANESVVSTRAASGSASLDVTKNVTTTATAIGGDTNVTIKASTATSYSDPLRFYANNTVTVATASSDIVITSIEYTATTTSYGTVAKNATVKPSATASGSETITWTYDADDAVTTWTWKPSAQTRCSAFVVYYEDNSATKTLSSIALSGTVATQKIGKAFNPSGLTVTATYDDSSTKNVTSSVTWSVATVSAETTSVYATYDGKTSNALSFTPAEPTAEPTPVETTISAINAKKASDTSVTYRVSGTIKSISDTTSGYLIIGDDSGNTLQVWGLSATGGLTWDADNEKYTWTNPKNYGSNSATSGLQVGDEITIRGTLLYYNSKTMEIQGLLELIPPTGLTVTAPKTTLTGANEKVQASVSWTPANATYKGVTWYSGDTTVATVSSTGLIAAVANGTTQIYASSTYDGSIYGSIDITVDIVSVASVTIDCPTTTLTTPGATVTATATVLPDTVFDRGVTWSSSNTSVATVTNTGVITAVSEGTTEITAVSKSDGNYSDTVTITVAYTHVSSVSVTLGKTTIDTLGSTTQATATINPDGAYNKNYTWSSSDTNVATVSTSGLVTAVGNGECDIIATAADGGVQGSAHLTVYQEPAYASNKLVDLARSGITSGTYYTSASTFKCEKIDYCYVNVIKGTSYTPSFQMKSSAGLIYNKYALPENLKTVTLVYGGTAKPVLYVGAEAGAKTTEVTGVANATTGTIVFDIASLGSYKFFTIKSASAVTYLKSFELEFTGTESNEINGYVSAFNSTLDCASLDVTAEKWASVAAAYDALSERAKAAIAASKSDLAGTNLEKMLPLYDYVVAKYGVSNFLGRTISSSTFNLVERSSDSKTTAALVAASSLLGIGALLGVCLRRKKSK